MKVILASISIVLTMTLASAQQPSVHYTLGMPNPSTHLLEVAITLDNLPREFREIDFILPVWRPGRYMVMDFASGVQDVSVTDGSGKKLAWSKIEKSLWRVSINGNPKIIFRYNVYANEFGLRTRGLNDEHAFIDGCAVFMYVEKFRSFPLRLTINSYKNWHVTTGLEGKGKEFSAPNYDYLVDCPIEIGNQRDFGFTVEGVPHVLSIYGDGNWNADTLMRDMAKIVRTQKEFWGGFPYQRYVFLVHCTPSSGGGTEHINSTIMGTRPYVFKNPESYNGFLGLASHEYFHTWNVKQLRPKGIHPYDYTKENYSKELWIAEGTTSYYDDLLMIPAGFMTAEKYLERLALTIQNDRQRPGNTIQPLADASFDAWVKYWRGTEQAFNSESDYYGKGANVSLLLDLEIRQRSSNKHSLDDVLRRMYQQFPLSGAGYTLDDVRKTSEEKSGAGLQEFFDTCIYSAAPLPWEEKLSYAGLQLSSRDSAAKPWIGLVTNDAGERTRITRVVAGSPAYHSGLDAGDEILALNGSRVRTSELNDRISNLEAGNTVKLTVFRNDRLREFSVTIGTNPVPNYRITRTSSPTALQKQIYESWLRTSWEPTGPSGPTAH